MVSNVSLNVTGHWDGIFNYPRHKAPNAFHAEFREVGGVISGETTERSDWHRNRGATLVALLEGQRVGTSVNFVKRYDERQTPVLYAGTLSADGLEITGQWTIPGNWSGSFILVRSPSSSAAEERRVAETVR